MDAPLLVRGDPVQHDLLVAVGLLSQHRRDGLGADRRAVAHEALAEGQHPLVVEVELLAAGERAPRDQLVHVGIAGVVADVLVFQARPDRRGDDLARLRLQIAETDRLVLLAFSQVGMAASGEGLERGPGLDRDLTIGFRRQMQDDLAGIDRGLDLRAALADAVFGNGVIELAEEFHLVPGIPVQALAAVAELVQQRAQRGEFLVQVRVVALDHDHRGHGPAGDRLALAALPVGHTEWHRQLVRGVVQGRHQHQVLLDAQHPRRQFADATGDTLEDLPVAARLPGRIHRFGQRVDEGMHVRSAEVVLLVPGRGRQDDVGIQRRGAHAEVERDQQVELALRGLVAPFHVLRLGRAALTQVLALQAMAGAEQVLEHVLVALARRAKQVGSPDEHVAREVFRRLRVGEGEIQLAGLELAHRVLHRIQAVGLGIAHERQRIGIELRCRRQPAHAHRAQVEVHQ